MTTRAPAPGWRSASLVDTQYRLDAGRRDSRARRRLPVVRRRQPALRARLRRAAPARAGRADEPVLRGREHADLDRRTRRSSAAARARARSKPSRGRSRRRSASRRAAAGIVADVASARSRWIAAVAKDLQAHRARAWSIAGDTQPPAVHALAHAINQRARQRRPHRRLHRSGRRRRRSIRRSRCAISSAT